MVVVASIVIVIVVIIAVGVGIGLGVASLLKGGLSATVVGQGLGCLLCLLRCAIAYKVLAAVASTVCAAPQCPSLPHLRSCLRCLVLGYEASRQSSR